MSRHRAKTPKGRLRRWLSLSHATLAAPEPARGRELRLVPKDTDQTPAETKTGTPFDGRLRLATPEPSQAAPWTPQAAEPEAAPEPLRPAEPEPAAAILDEHQLDLFASSVRGYTAPFADSGRAGGVR